MARLAPELRIFAHAQFEAEEYVQGVCREAGTGQQIRQQLENLRTLREVANDGLLRGAQDQASTYVAATKKIRATALELSRMVQHLREFEDGLAELDDALAESLGENEPRAENANGRRGRRREGGPQPRRGRRGLSQEPTPPPQQQPSRQVDPRRGASQEPRRDDPRSLFRRGSSREPSVDRRRGASEEPRRSAERRSVTPMGRRANSDDDEEFGADAFDEIDELARANRLGAAVSLWLRLSRDLRKVKKRLTKKETDDLAALLEARRGPLAATVENSPVVDDEARERFGFGTSLRDAARGAGNEYVPPVARALFGLVDEERDSRARDAMLHGLGRKVIDDRLASYERALDQLRETDATRFWDGLAFAIDDSWALFKSTDPKKAAKLEETLLAFATSQARAYVGDLAEDVAPRGDPDKREALSAAARLARLARAGSKALDAVRDGKPPKLASRSLLMDALAPKLATFLGPPLNVSPTAIRAALDDDDDLCAAIISIHAKLARDL